MNLDESILGIVNESVLSDARNRIAAYHKRVDFAAKKLHRGSNVVANTRHILDDALEGVNKGRVPRNWRRLDAAVYDVEEAAGMRDEFAGGNSRNKK